MKAPTKLAVLFLLAAILAGCTTANDQMASEVEITILN